MKRCALIAVFPVLISCRDTSSPVAASNTAGGSRFAAERVPVVPGHPLLGLGGQVFGRGDCLGLSVEEGVEKVGELPVGPVQR